MEALARSGVGALTLMDLDEVCISNTNRQLHSLGDTVGRSMAAVLAERVARINPECAVRVREEWLTVDGRSTSCATSRSGLPDFAVLDAIDGVYEKAALVAACATRRAPRDVRRGGRQVGARARARGRPRVHAQRHAPRRDATHLGPVVPPVDAVDLQPDVAAGRHRVEQVRRGHAVDPRLDPRTPGEDRDLVPRLRAATPAGRRVCRSAGRSAAAALVVDPAAVGAAGGRPRPGSRGPGRGGDRMPTTWLRTWTPELSDSVLTS